LIAHWDNLVVIDTAAREWGYPIVEDPDELLRHSAVAWRPPLACIRRPARDESDPWSVGLSHLWNVRGRPGGGGVLVVIDELMVACPTHPHRLLEEIVIQGMGRGVGVWGCSQGPWDVYPLVIRNAVVRVLFRLHNKAARGAVGADLDLDGASGIAALKDHEWLYWRQGMAAGAGPFDLKTLGRAQIRPVTESPRPVRQVPPVATQRSFDAPEEGL
jgi:hypothetical protein